MKLTDIIKIKKVNMLLATDNVHITMERVYPDCLVEKLLDNYRDLVRLEIEELKAEEDYMGNSFLFQNKEFERLRLLYRQLGIDWPEIRSLEL